MSFKDHFSRQSSDYSRYRPHYPTALFTYLAAQTANHQRAWDCGTGNGQAALGLAPFFQEIIATDPSPQQIAHAVAHHRLRYAVASAEDSGLDNGSVDLITAAQALHWFDLDRFYAEARRVLRPGGVLAVWCYGLTRISPAADRILMSFYSDTLGPFWPPERRLVEDGYRSLPFPFPELKPPGFEMTAEWNLEHLLSYLSTWSAVQRYREQHPNDPLDSIRSRLSCAWGRPEKLLPVRWPISLRLGGQPNSV